MIQLKYEKHATTGVLDSALLTRFLNIASIAAQQESRVYRFTDASQEASILDIAVTLRGVARESLVGESK